MSTPFSPPCFALQALSVLSLAPLQPQLVKCAPKALTAHLAAPLPYFVAQGSTGHLQAFLLLPAAELAARPLDTLALWGLSVHQALPCARLVFFVLVATLPL